MTMVDDDSLLASLGAVASRQRQRSTYERVATGEVSREELAELERLAVEDPDARVLLEAARPLDEAALERIANAVAARVSPVRRLRRWRRRIGMTAGGLALAASIALWRMSDRGSGLPLYALDSSGAASSRALPRPVVACVVRADQRGSFEVLARPNDAVEGTLAAQAFIVRHGEVEPFSGNLEVSAKGSVRLTGENRNLIGASELRVVVGRPHLLEPADARVKAREHSESGHGWQVLRCAVEGT